MKVRLNNKRNTNLQQPKKLYLNWYSRAGGKRGNPVVFVFIFIFIAHQ
jgi:hypothetical protein